MACALETAGQIAKTVVSLRVDYSSEGRGICSLRARPRPRRFRFAEGFEVGAGLGVAKEWGSLDVAENSFS